MYKVALELETITPMFMYGATGEPELRASEFKGMMRFWWRAAYGGNDIEEMRKRENEIFGSTTEKSNVKIVVSEFDTNYSQSLQSLKSDIDLSYIYFSPILQGKRTAIKSKYRFMIEITSLDHKAMEEALKSFWLAVIFSGFGGRARRCGGNLRVLNVTSENIEIPLSFRFKDIKNIGRNINQFIRPKNYGYKYSTFPKVIYFRKLNDKSWEEQVKYASQLLKKLRLDKDNRKFRKYFGLPFKNLKDRRSSPFVLKITEVADSYFLLSYFFSGNYFKVNDEEFNNFKNKICNDLKKEKFQILWRRS